LDTLFQFWVINLNLLYIGLMQNYLQNITLKRLINKKGKKTHTHAKH